jgi:hypothetical protein
MSSHTGVAVSDLPRAVRWFDRLFGDVFDGFRKAIYSDLDGNEIGIGGPATGVSDTG